jgi:hypothetical protein
MLDEEEEKPKAKKQDWIVASHCEQIHLCWKIMASVLPFRRRKERQTSCATNVSFVNFLCDNELSIRFWSSNLLCSWRVYLFLGLVESLLVLTDLCCQWTPCKFRDGTLAFHRPISPKGDNEVGDWSSWENAS